MNIYCFIICINTDTYASVLNNRIPLSNFKDAFRIRRNQYSNFYYAHIPVR